MRTFIRGCLLLVLSGPMYFLPFSQPLCAQGNIGWEELYMVMQPAAPAGT